jgi:hypothetical protein
VIPQGSGLPLIGGFYPIDQFTPSFSFKPPTLTANADLYANLIPTLEVTVDGFAHANLALSAGLALDANTGAEPWRTLTAPVEVSANLDLGVPGILDLSGPTLDIYKHTFTLATAGGPLHSVPPTPGPQPGILSIVAGNAQSGAPTPGPATVAICEPPRAHAKHAGAESLSSPELDSTPAVACRAVLNTGGPRPSRYGRTRIRIGFRCRRFARSVRCSEHAFVVSVAFDGVTFGASLAASLITGGVGAAWITASLTDRAEEAKQRILRRGRARILHEDLMHLQSTLSRTFYDGEAAWWQDAWLRPLATSEEDRQDLFAALERSEFTTLASGLGWVEYLIAGKRAGLPPPSDADLCDIYRRLAGARYALARVGDFAYRPHDPQQMKPEHGGRVDGEEMPRIEPEEARAICDARAAT